MAALDTLADTAQTAAPGIFSGSLRTVADRSEKSTSFFSARDDGSGHRSRLQMPVEPAVD